MGALLLKINSRKSFGYDGIPPRLVKESANGIAGPIAAIMKSLDYDRTVSVALEIRSSYSFI